MYKLRTDGSQTVDVRFVDLENVWIDPDTGKQYNLNKTDYLLPEAFTWEDPEDSTKVVQLTGYWLSKYKLREDSTYHPTIYGLGGAIGVDGVVDHFGSSYTYEMYLIKDGKRIVKNEETKLYEEGVEPIILTENYKFTGLDAGRYSVNIIIKDSDGNHVQAVSNQVTVLEKVKENPPDLLKYNKDLTYYVTYSADGKENSITPIGETEPANWYDYDEGINATIVVRDAGTEKYYEWIPRYQCKTTDSTHIMYIKTDKVEPDVGYTIPEEFTIKNEKGETIQLSGYWKEKGTYSNRLLATVAAGENKIRVSNITSTVTATTYNIYLIKDGKKVDNALVTSNGEHTFNIVASGKYVVFIEQTNTITGTVAGFAKEVRVQPLETPDVTGFRIDTTYIVKYDDEGNEDISQTIESVLKDGYTVDSNNALVSGQIDISKISGTWYDYTEQKWANIVTINNEKTIYFTWIPRYEYKLDTTNQKVNAILIPKTQEIADEGYQISEAFTWEDPNDSTKVVQLNGYWLSKYKLRQ